MLSLAIGKRSVHCATVWMHDSTACMRYVLGYISFTINYPHNRGEHPQHPHDQPGQRQATRRIVCTAGAAAWLPHAKHRDTRTTSG